GTASATRSACCCGVSSACWRARVCAGHQARACAPSPAAPPAPCRHRRRPSRRSLATSKPSAMLEPNRPRAACASSSLRCARPSQGDPGGGGLMSRFEGGLLRQVLGLQVRLYACCARLSAGTDSEALHDLRIALRRLASLLRPL